MWTSHTYQNTVNQHVKWTILGEVSKHTSNPDSPFRCCTHTHVHSYPIVEHKHSYRNHRMAPRRKNLKGKAGDSKSNGTSGRRKVCSRMGTSKKFAHRTLRQSTWWLTWRQRWKVSQKLYQWRTTNRVMEWWRDIYAWRAAKLIRKAGGGKWSRSCWQSFLTKGADRFS